MLHFVLLLNLIFGVGWSVESKDSSYDGDSDFGAGMISSLRNDANLDLSVDEEYEDLRAELLAYHTALASLTAKQNRRSMMTTPCWELGGICVNVNLCTGFRYLTEIPGCKDKMNVCCFAWNKFRVKDFKDHGIGTAAFPWSLKQGFGGKGVLEVEPETKKERHGRGKGKRQDEFQGGRHQALKAPSVKSAKELYKKRQIKHGPVIIGVKPLKLI